MTREDCAPSDKTLPASGEAAPRRACVGPSQRQPAEEENRRVRAETTGQCVNDLGVADQLRVMSRSARPMS
jgi:hypothetical protein